jgi:hypothetical protein
MKNAVVLFLSFAALALAQDKTPETVKRLDSVTWDLSTHKLVWVVQTGTKADGEFVPASSAKYEVSPDEASMMFADEKRGLSEEEADSLHHLLDVLSLYCAESTVWWDQGQGEGGGKGTGVPTEQKTTTTPKPAGKIVKVDNQPQSAPKPAPKAAPNIVAEAH